MSNSLNSSEHGLSSLWTEAVQEYGFDKAKQMYENEQCFRCGRKGHRVSACRSQQGIPELNTSSNLEMENEGRVEVESEKDEGRDE